MARPQMPENEESKQILIDMHRRLHEEGKLNNSFFDVDSDRYCRENRFRREKAPTSSPVVDYLFSGGSNFNGGVLKEHFQDPHEKITLLKKERQYLKIGPDAEDARVAAFRDIENGFVSEFEGYVRKEEDAPQISYDEKKSKVFSIARAIGTRLEGCFGNLDDINEWLFKENDLGPLGEYILHHYENSEQIKDLCIKILQTSYFITRDINGQRYLENDESFQNKFQAVKTGISTDACVGGSIAALDKIYQDIALSGRSLWPEIRDDLIKTLQPYCRYGNHSHLPSWIDYIVSGVQGGDGQLFTASFDMTQEDVRRVVEMLTLRRSELVIGYLASKYFEVFKTIDQESLRKVDREQGDDQDNSMEYNGQFYIELENKKLTHDLLNFFSDDVSVNQQKIYEIASALFRYEDDNGQKKVDKAAIIKLIKERIPPEHLVPSPRFNFIFDVNEGVHQDFARVLIAMNSFAVRNKPIPVWLRKLACNVILHDDLMGVCSQLTIISSNQNRDKLNYFKEPYNKAKYDGYDDSKQIKDFQEILQQMHKKFVEDTNINIPYFNYSFHSFDLARDSNEELMKKGCDFEFLCRDTPKGKVELGGLYLNPRSKEVIELIKKGIRFVDVENDIYGALLLGDLAILREFPEALSKFFKETHKGSMNLSSAEGFLTKTHIEILLEFCAKLFVNETRNDFLVNVLRSKVEMYDETTRKHITVPLIRNIIMFNTETAFAILDKIQKEPRGDECIIRVFSDYKQVMECISFKIVSPSDQEGLVIFNKLEKLLIDNVKTEELSDDGKKRWVSMANLFIKRFIDYACRNVEKDRFQESLFKLYERMSKLLPDGVLQSSKNDSSIHKTERYGFNRATLELGKCYEFGIGTEIDYAKASKCYKAVSENACKDIPDSMTRGYLDDLDASAKRLIKKMNALRNPNPNAAVAAARPVSPAVERGHNDAQRQ